MEYESGVELLRTRHKIARAWSEFFADYPIIVGPTWCEPQFAHGYDIAGPTSAADIINLMRFVTPMNLLGLPVVCVPTGVAAALPAGVQVIGDRFREDVCLDAAAAIEERLGAYAHPHRRACFGDRISRTGLIADCEIACQKHHME